MSLSNIPEHNSAKDIYVDPAIIVEEITKHFGTLNDHEIEIMTGYCTSPQYQHATNIFGIDLHDDEKLYGSLIIDANDLVQQLEKGLDILKNDILSKNIRSVYVSCEPEIDYDDYSKTGNYELRFNAYLEKANLHTQVKSDIINAIQRYRKEVEQRQKREEKEKNYANAIEELTKKLQKKKISTEDFRAQMEKVVKEFKVL